jgi:hypothetical protein
MRRPCCGLGAADFDTVGEAICMPDLIELSTPGTVPVSSTWPLQRLAGRQPRTDYVGAQSHSIVLLRE